MNKEMLKSKTFWTGVVSIIGAVGGVVTGTLTLDAGVQTGIMSILAIFLRDGIAKK